MKEITLENFEKLLDTPLSERMEDLRRYHPGTILSALERRCEELIREYASSIAGPHLDNIENLPEMYWPYLWGLGIPFGELPAKTREWLAKRPPYHGITVVPEEVEKFIRYSYAVGSNPLPHLRTMGYRAEYARKLKRIYLSREGHGIATIIL